MKKTSSSPLHSSVRTGLTVAGIIVHLTVAAAMLSLGTVSIHMLLKSESRLLDESLLLKSLERLEAHLDADSILYSSQSVTENELLLKSDSRAATARYTIRRGRVDRTLHINEELNSRERFVFPAGTTVRFDSTDSMGFTVTITEGFGTLQYPAAGDGGSPVTGLDSDTFPRPPRGTAAPPQTIMTFPGASAANAQEVQP